MFKSHELSDPNSCLNRAAGDEMIFVLRAKDPAAASAIRSWIGFRVALGMNKPLDQKLVSAEACAVVMENQCISRHTGFGIDNKQPDRGIAFGGIGNETKG